MYRILTIWIVLGWFIFSPAQQFGDNFKLAYPELVRQGKTFEVSIITSNDFAKSDKLDLYIIPERGIKLESVIMRTGDEEQNIKVSSAFNVFNKFKRTLSQTGWFLLPDTNEI